MFWKKRKQESSAAEAAAEIVQGLGNEISTLVCHANDAFEAQDFKRAGDSMFSAALLAWQICGIQVEAEILQILGKAKIEVVN